MRRAPASAVAEEEVLDEDEQEETISCLARRQQAQAVWWRRTFAAIWVLLSGVFAWLGFLSSSRDKVLEEFVPLYESAEVSFGLLAGAVLAAALFVQGSARLRVAALALAMLLMVQPLWVVSNGGGAALVNLELELALKTLVALAVFVWAASLFLQHEFSEERLARDITEMRSLRYKFKKA